jgi:hypothetical protein
MRPNGRSLQSRLAWVGVAGRVRRGSDHPWVKPAGFEMDSAENLSISAVFDGVVSPIVSPGVKDPVGFRRMAHRGKSRRLSARAGSSG